MNLPDFFPTVAQLLQMLPVAVVILGGLYFGTLLLEWRERKRLERLLRSEWGQGNPDRLTYLPSVAEWHRFHRQGEDADGLVDDRTWDDLDLDQIFLRLDHTQSRMGQQVLYDQLHRTLAPASLEHFERRVTRFDRDVPLRETVRRLLVPLNAPPLRDLWRLAVPGALTLNRWFALVPVVSVAMVVVVIAALMRTSGAAIAVFFLILVSLGLRSLLSSSIGMVVEPFSRLGQFFAVVERLARLPGEEFAAGNQEMQRLLGSLRRIRGRIWLAGSGARSDLFSVILTCINLFFLLDFVAMRLVAGEMARLGPELLLLMRRVGEIDAAQAIASWRAGQPGWLRPVFHGDAAPVHIEGLRHPLLADAVPHSLAMAPPHGLLVTGSNMSGKSTLLRNLGVAAVLAQSTGTVLATRYDAPRYVVRGCIGRGDDLLGGKSYYLAEVERVLELARGATSARPHLLLFDELFRGTNTVERIAAGEAVLREILQPGPDGSVRHLVLAATHDGELVDLLADLYAPWHLAETVDADGLRFDYQLRPGPATSRNAITLLRLHGASATLTDGATRRAAQLDAARLTRAGGPHV